MKIHLIRKETIEDYVVGHAGSRVSFKDFLEKLKYADWEKPTDIKATFPAADLLGKSCNRVVFDIAGNSYRMITKYAFGERLVHLFICWIGTHAEYTTLCNSAKQYTANQF
jgi:mRNA interferase HigB